MVSKIILASVATLALISMIQATPPKTNYAPCGQSMMYLNKKFNLGINVNSLLENVLGLAGNIIKSLLGGLLGGGGGGGGGSQSPPPYVPPPKDLNSALQLGLGYCKLLDSLLSLQVTAFPKGLLSNLYVYLVVNGLATVNVNLGSFKQNNPLISLSLLKSQCQKAQNLINVGAFNGNLLQIGVYINNLLGLLSAKVDVNVLPKCIGSLLQIYAGVNLLGGYPNAGNLIDLNIGLFNGLLPQGVPAINSSQYQLGKNIKPNCGCLKKN